MLEIEELRYSINDLAIFSSTHQLVDAEDICHRLGILHGGEMKHQGIWADFMKRYEPPTIEQASMACISN